MLAKNKKTKVKFKHPHLVISMPPCPRDQIVGLRAVEGHLPEILRYPGEPFEALMQRALIRAKGRGRFAVTCIVREVPNAMAR